ncbi:MAG: hypothetical protein JWM98_766 [Thermoleophilia bacterium]|nr:hypothetical protein [Thermoleophilia bacterium]
MAAAPSRNRRGTVHVHGAEVSTDRDSAMRYAETLALLLALAAFLVASWIVAVPRDGAELLQPDTDGPASRFGRQVQHQSTVLANTTDVLQPIPGGRSSTSVPLQAVAPAGNVGAADGGSGATRAVEATPN